MKSWTAPGSYGKVGVFLQQPPDTSPGNAVPDRIQRNLKDPRSMSSSLHILIVEDESSIADTLTYALEKDYFQVTWLETAQAAMQALNQGSAQTPFDLVILDVGLPDMSGFDVLRTLRQQSQLPVIMLTARSEEIDRILGLEIGADDYVTKPFSPREVVARVKAVLKRLTLAASLPVPPRAMTADTPPLSTTTANVRRHGALQLDSDTRQVQFHQQPVQLTLAEFGLLEALLKANGRVLTRPQLMESIWTPNHPSDERVIDTHIKTLRAKLRDIHQQDDPIQTHRGVGYSLKLLGRS